MEQRQVSGPEATAKIEGNLGDTCTPEMRVSDISNSGVVSSRAMVLQQKTSQPVQFEITEGTRESIADWMLEIGVSGSAYLFPSRISASPHLSTRQYARIVEKWVSEIGLDSALYGTHMMYQRL